MSRLCFPQNSHFALAVAVSNGMSAKRTCALSLPIKARL